MKKKEIKDVCIRLTQETAKKLKAKAKQMKTFQSVIAEKGIKRELERMEI